MIICPPIVWALGIKFKSLGLVASAFLYPLSNLSRPRPMTILKDNKDKIKAMF